MSQDVLCPVCGSPMRIRTARRGRWVGKQFYSCSQYPHCRGTRPIDEDEEDSNDGTFNSLPVRRTINAEPLHASAQVAFFDVLALPPSVVRVLHEQGVDTQVVRGASQWRLDYPDIQGAPRPSQDVLIALTVLEALLLRGTTPLCTPLVRQVVEDLYGKISEADVNALVEGFRSYGHALPFRFDPQWFQRYDSPAEEGFAWELSRAMREGAASVCCIPQLHTYSIVSSQTVDSGTRVDFYLSHPSGNVLVVEVDGTQHRIQKGRDQASDDALALAGVRVSRIPAAMSADEAVKAALAELPGNSLGERSGSAFVNLLMMCKIASALQVAILRALQSGLLSEGKNRIDVVVPDEVAAVPGLSSVVEAAIADSERALAHLLAIYNVSREFSFDAKSVSAEWIGTQEDATLTIALGCRPASGDSRTMIVSDTFLHRAFLPPSSGISSLPGRISPSRERVRWFLQWVFDKEDFLDGQWEVIERLLAGKDCVVLLPTGGGKSISFQLPALLRPGRCLIVAPIVSLMEDQVYNLRQYGIDRAVGLSTAMVGGSEERRLATELMADGYYLFTYVSPERLQIKEFREALRSVTALTPVSVAAIDEAHCVSEWGHDFRTAYLHLGRLLREYCSFQDGISPPVAALTGTASRIVLRDVQRELGILDTEAVIQPKTFDRKELSFQILTCRSDEKPARLKGVFRGLPSLFGVEPTRFYRTHSSQSYCGVVFCPHVRGEYGVHEVADSIVQNLSIPVETYSGRDSAERRREASLKFKRNTVTTLVATKAYGMGIDKPNIRYVIHYGVPSSIEAYYQEVGRGGRDRNQCHCVILVSVDRKNLDLLRPDTPLPKLKDAAHEIPWEARDDVLRALWFHANAFVGQEEELKHTFELLKLIGDTETPRSVSVSWIDAKWIAEVAGSDRNPEERARAVLEKAVHRLVLCGVIRDFTMDYARRACELRIPGASKEEIEESYYAFVKSYNSRLAAQERSALAGELAALDRGEFIRATLRRLSQFIYTHVELARRRSLSEMVQAAAVSKDGEQFRARILQYLQQTPWDDRLDSLRESADLEPDQLQSLLEELISRSDFLELRASAGRALASYPDVPLLLLMRAVAESGLEDGDLDRAREDAAAFLSFGLQKYGFSPEALVEAISVVSRFLIEKSKAPTPFLTAFVQCAAADRNSVRRLCCTLGSAHQAGPLLVYLHAKLARRVRALVDLYSKEVVIHE